MIVAEGLSKFYAGTRAIDDISFKIDQGEIVGLLGLNGAGKSTILKVLGCFLMPSKGKASVGGYSVTDDPHEIRKLIGYLPDTPPLYDEMTVLSYLRYVAKLKNVTGQNLNQRVDYAMEKTDITKAKDVALASLSHGFRQRVGIAQALVHDPKVLILDEPINGLDPVQIVEMRDLILSLRGSHTVILSSHILSEITKTCDRVLVIHNGNLVAEGSETDLKKDLSQKLKLIYECQSINEEMIAKVRGIKGVSHVQSADSSHIRVETEMDCRVDISKEIVDSGAGLISMRMEEGGLESVFMGLVKDQPGGHA